MNSKQSLPRRDFIKFLGRTGASISVLGQLPLLNACQHTSYSELSHSLKAIHPQNKDEFIVSPSLSHEVLIQHQQTINSKNETFGYNNDFTAYIPFDKNNPYRGWLWVNHEAPNSLFINGKTRKQNRTKDEIQKELQSVGGSIIEIYRDEKDLKWKVNYNSKYNKRLDALTPIPYSNETKINNSNIAIGTLGNCAGGLTPWKTFLTCEENYHMFYGEYDYTKPNKALPFTGYFGWAKYFPQSPEQYGWVVEIDPKTGKGQKHVSMGRFAHEGATVTIAKDRRAVVYMGDDKEGQCIYKFISEKPNDLSTGVLYVANTKSGQWVELSLKQEILKKTFKTQTDLLIQTRRAAQIMGGTPHDRPEGIAIDPMTGAVIVSLSNNKYKNNFHGSLFKIEEHEANPLSMTFKSSTLVMGGKESGLSCPDNVAFDSEGHLWVTNDIDDRKINKGVYKNFKNNGLFMIPMSGPQKNKVIQVASGPTECELTGPFFLPDGALLISVQHPGNRSKSLTELTSHWPNGGDSVPKPSVVVIYPGHIT